MTKGELTSEQQIKLAQIYRSQKAQGKALTPDQEARIRQDDIRLDPGLEEREWKEFNLEMELEFGSKPVTQIREESRKLGLDILKTSPKPMTAVKPILDSVTRQEVAELAPTPHSYTFPPPAEKSLSGHDATELILELEEISFRARSGEDYALLRDKYCAISIELNKRGLFAPGFRPHPAIPRLASSRTLSHMTLLRDRIVIDCHWLHSRREFVKVTKEEAQWMGLLALDRPFDWVRVSAFAATGINTIHRADSLLYLSIRQQCQMLALKGADVAERAARLFRGNRLSKSRTPPAIVRIRQAINRWCEKDKRVSRYNEKYLAYATAVYLLGADRTIPETAELAGFILGETPLNESTARSTIAKLLKRLPELAPHPVAFVSAHA